MKNNRRDFLKTVTAVGASALASNQVIAQTSHIPAVSSLLLEDDSPVVNCGDVNCSSLSVTLSYSNAAASLILQLETPGGSRIVNEGVSSNVDGQCNQWELNVGGAGGTTYDIGLVGTSINPGRYQIFVTRNISGNESVLINAAACGITFATGFSPLFVADESKHLGSINISSGGTPTIRIGA